MMFTTQAQDELVEIESRTAGGVGRMVSVRTRGLGPSAWESAAQMRPHAETDYVRDLKRLLAERGLTTQGELITEGAGNDRP